MRKILVLLALLMSFAVPLRSQSLTSVTATVSDSAGTAYSFGSYTVNLVNTTSQQPLFGGNANFQQIYSGGLDTNGLFSISLPSVTVMTPSPGLQWKFFICANPLQIAAVFPKPALPCFTYTSTGTQISGSSVDLSSSMTPTVVPKTGQGGAGTFTTITCTSVNLVRCVSPSNPQGWAGADPGAQINSALSCSGGCDVQLAAGTYAVSTAIVVPSQTRLLLAAGTVINWSGTGCTLNMDNQSAVLGPGAEEAIIFNSTTTGLCKKSSLTQVFDVSLQGFSIRDNNTGASTTTGFDFTGFSRSFWMDLNSQFKLKGYLLATSPGVQNYFNRGYHLKAFDTKTCIDLDSGATSINENIFYGTDCNRNAGTWDAGGGEIGLNISGVGNRFYGVHISAAGGTSTAVRFKPSPSPNTNNQIVGLYSDSTPTIDVDATNVVGPNEIDGLQSDGRTSPIILDPNGQLRIQSENASLNIGGVGGQPAIQYARSTPANGSGTGFGINYTWFRPPAGNGDPGSPAPLNGAMAYRADLFRPRFFETGATLWHSIPGIDTVDALTNKLQLGLQEVAMPSGVGGNSIIAADITTHTPSWNNNSNGTSSPTGAWQCTNVTPVTTSGGAVTTDQNLMACTIPAGTLNRVARTLRVKVAGIYSTPAASVSQMTLKVKICSVSGCGSGNVLTALSIQSTALGTVQITNDNFSLRGELTTQTGGATLAEEAHGEYLIDLATLTTAADSVFGDGNTATQTGTPSAIDSTAQNFLQVTFAFSAASASNVATQRQLILETVN